jgi:hypothetical protein
MLSGPPSAWLPFERLSNREGRLVTVRVLTIDHFVQDARATGQPPWMTPSASSPVSVGDFSVAQHPHGVGADGWRGSESRRARPGRRTNMNRPTGPI